MTDEVIRAAVVKARKSAAAAPAVRVKDTITTDGTVDATPDRSTLYAVQTPRRSLTAICSPPRCRMQKRRASPSRTTAAP